MLQLCCLPSKDHAVMARMPQGCGVERAEGAKRPYSCHRLPIIVMPASNTEPPEDLRARLEQPVIIQPGESCLCFGAAAAASVGAHGYNAFLASPSQTEPTSHSKHNFQSLRRRSITMYTMARPWLIVGSTVHVLGTACYCYR